MGFRDVRVVIVSGDHLFYRMTSDRLAADPKVESTSNVLGLLSVQGLMSAQLCNVVIVDIDTCSASEQYLKQLTERNKLHVILTALSSHKAKDYKPSANQTFLQKPRALTDAYLKTFTDEISNVIQTFTDVMPHLSFHGMQKTVDIKQKIVVVASSTGGTEAIERLLKCFTADIPPILVVQHMPSGFTKFFADRLNNICPMTIREAKDNDYVQKGVVLIAPADKHMRLVRRSNKLMVECFVGNKIHGVMPAADILFESVAPIMHKNVIGVILTGMGSDGARGMMVMHNAGAYTIGQDKESCVVYGMPKVAFDLGALDVQLPLDKIAEEIKRRL